jgi:predicted  nucleic acid-binding Zn-ribbon protein
MKKEVKEINDLRNEIRSLRTTVTELRKAMESFDLFQQDDEVGVALANVEARLDMVQYKALTNSIAPPTAKKVLEKFEKSCQKG